MFENIYINILEKYLCYKFNNKNILIQSLINIKKKYNNERFELLGDSILNFIITYILFNKFNDANEGIISHIRSSLINKYTLSKISSNVKLLDFLLIFNKNIKKLDLSNQSMLSNSIESILCAVFMDSGLQSVYNLVYFLYYPYINLINLSSIKRDYKSILHEFYKNNYKTSPKYKVVYKNELNFSKEFKVLCFIPILKINSLGKGINKKTAEQNAAKYALKYIRQYIFNVKFFNLLF